MAQEIITLENLAAEIAKLRGELATWKALAIKQDRLNTAQMLAVNSGATAGKIAQIATNTSDIAALQQIASSAFRVVKVAQLPASGESYIMYLVPQTDGETLNYCNEYLWIDNAWELVGTTGAMANNGELQIIVNGVTVGTFTANQATDSTASITVPTDTSQLTNGAGYVDATALATALASKQDSLSLTQLAAVNSGITSTDVAQIGANTTAIAGKQDALTTSQLAAVNSGITSADVTQIGTNKGNIATNSAAIVSLQGSKQNALSAAQLLAVNSGITSSLVTQIGTNQSDISTLNTALGQSLTPSADNTYSLGGASFRYATVYAVTFTGDLTGTASKAIADEDGTSIKTGYGKLAGNQTWSGTNTFTNNLLTRDPSSVSAGSYGKGINFYDSTSTRYGYIQPHITTNNSRNLTLGADTGYLELGSHLVPYANSGVSLGQPSLRWSSVYADSYYYGTTAWGLDKSNVWTGSNTFSSINRKFWSVEKGVLPTVNNDRYTYFLDKNGATLGYTQISYNTAGNLVYSVWLQNSFGNGQLDPTGTDKYTTIGLTLKGDGSRFFSVYADAIPNNNGFFNLGSSSYQWSSVYAQNYYYNGTAWGLDKENVWTGISNTFSSILNQNINSVYSEIPSSDHFAVKGITDNNGNNVFVISFADRSSGQRDLTLRVYDTNGVSEGVGLYKNSDNSRDFKPMSNALVNLGTSTSKWKTLNGINPGALSLPDYSNAISIDTTNWSKTGEMIVYTPAISGWLQITIPGTDGNVLAILDSGNSPLAGQEWHSTGSTRIYLTYPVLANRVYWLFVKAASITTARLVPCLGNV